MVWTIPFLVTRYTCQPVFCCFTGLFRRGCVVGHRGYIKITARLMQFYTNPLTLIGKLAVTLNMPKPFMGLLTQKKRLKTVGCFWWKQLYIFLYCWTGGSVVYFRGKRRRIRRTQRLGVRLGGRLQFIRVQKIYIRGGYRVMKRLGRNWYVSLFRKWRLLKRGKKWYYKYKRGWRRIKRVRLLSRILRRYYSIRPRGRKGYIVRIRGRRRRIVQKPVRYIRVGSKVMRVRRRGRRVILRYGKTRRSRPLKVIRFRE